MVGAACVFTQLRGGTSYQVVVREEEVVVDVVVEVDPFVRASGLIRRKYLASPSRFSLDRGDIPQDAWVCLLFPPHSLTSR
jgi:hypothetical protein